MKSMAIVTCLFLVSLTFGNSANAAERPNVILIMADDVGHECFGCYGSEQYKTPNLDRMAKNGMLFRHCYSQPLCTPSRVKLMTGRSNVRNYSGFSILNRGEQTIGHYFQRAGYETVVAGKWQLFGAEHYKPQFRAKGSRPKTAGFDHHCLWQVDRLGSRYWDPLLHIDGKNETFTATDYGPERVTDYLVDYLDSKWNRKGPFFIYYPMILVHSPFPTTPHSEDAKSKNKQKNFEDMVAYMDHVVGRLVKQTEKLGIANNTLILFTGDNGTHRTIKSRLNGETIVGGKGSTTDAGTREPLIAYWPGRIAKGAVNENLVDFSDFLPTLLEAAGAPAPEPTDGISFYKQLIGQAAQPREWVFCYYNPRPEKTKPVRFVRDVKWKLYGDGRFYNVQRDSKEKSALTMLQQSGEANQARERLQQVMDSMPTKGQSLLQFGTE